MTRALLLDTHAAIWLVEGRLTQKSLDEVVLAGLADGCFVSAATAWEVGLLARKNAQGLARYAALPDPLSWYSSLIAQPLITETPLSAEILIASSHLPGEFHSDPADRMLVATARHLDVPLMTRDKPIHDYAAQGHCRVVPC